MVVRISDSAIFHSGCTCQCARIVRSPLNGCTGKIPWVNEERGECYPQVRKGLHSIDELACTDRKKGVVQEEKAAAIPSIGKSCT